MNNDVILRVLALMLPRAVRARYLEEWRADSFAAADAGLRRRDIVRGAAALTVTIDRDLPANTDEPRGAVPRRLARRGLGLFAAAAVVLAGAWLTNGGILPEGPSTSPQALDALNTVAWISLRLAMLAILVGVLYFGRAAIMARTTLARTAAAAAMTGPITIALAVTFDPHWTVLLAGIVLSAFGFAAGLAVVTGPSPLSLERRVASWSVRLPAAMLGAVVVALILVIGAVDLLVWNPQTQVPGLSLHAIYAQMSEVDQFSQSTALVQVTLWAALWGGLAAAVVFRAARRSQTWMTPRRVSILLLAIIGGAVFFRFFAGFSIGMSIADTFRTTGANTSIVSAVLPYVGQFALATAAVLSGWAPKIHNANTSEARDVAVA
ncbi:hypothetical protein E3T55_12810 [Cryobacterium frigoriphilum]|uniref:Uncharacterized protein n=1 Tax=Cryobacterium frigoriphilum TaxID=1259150 RepID=A0A4R8ZYY9_9MICO|nr:hypothetical protein [Cryobacterium frigoriphilum]TFD48919.1 hypothetical protein E3T55_12810 [Cryobacterium frigoriphilum]